MTSGFLLRKPISFFCDNSAGCFRIEELGYGFCGHSEFRICSYSSIQLSGNLLVLLPYQFCLIFSDHSGDKIPFLPSLLLLYFQKCRCFLKVSFYPLLFVLLVILQWLLAQIQPPYLSSWFLDLHLTWGPDLESPSVSLRSSPTETQV